MLEEGHPSTNTGSLFPWERARVRERTEQLDRTALTPTLSRSAGKGENRLRVHIQPPAPTHHRAGDKARLIAHQEQRQVGDVLRLADAAQWRALLCCPKHLVRIDAAQELVVDQAWRYSIDADAIFADFCRHRPRIAHHRSLGRTVMRLAIVRANPACHRGQ